LLFPGSALEGGAVFESEGQAAIRVGRGVVQQAAPELFVEGGDIVVLIGRRWMSALWCFTEVM
jgi:hypothetical protein